MLQLKSLASYPEMFKPPLKASNPVPSGGHGLECGADLPPTSSRFGAEQTFELPLTNFPGDIVVPAGETMLVDVQGIMGDRCTGFTIICTMPCTASINGGGYRTIPSSMVLDGALIQNLSVRAAAGGDPAIVQLHGV